MTKEQSLVERHFQPFLTMDSPVEFVLFGYDGDSFTVLAQQSEDVALSLLGFCMSGRGSQARIGDFYFNQTDSEPLLIETKHDTRKKSLRFGWVSKRKLSTCEVHEVKEMLDRFGLDLHIALTAEKRNTNVVRKYLGPLIYACQLAELQNRPSSSWPLFASFIIPLAVAVVPLIIVLSMNYYPEITKDILFSVTLIVCSILSAGLTYIFLWRSRNYSAESLLGKTWFPGTVQTQNSLEVLRRRMERLLNQEPDHSAFAARLVEHLSHVRKLAEKAQEGTSSQQ